MERGARGAIPAVEQDARRSHCPWVHNVCEVRGVCLALGGARNCARAGRRRRGEVARGGELAYAFEFLIREWPRAGADELEAVVVEGVVRGGHHEPEAQVFRPGREVDFLRAAEPERDGLAPGLGHAAQGRRREACRRRPRVKPHAGRMGAEDLHRRARGAVVEGGRQVLPNDAAHVVGPEGRHVECWEHVAQGFSA